MEPAGETRQRRHQKKRRAEGRCGVEGCPEFTGKAYYCPTHKRQRTVAAVARAKARRDAMLAGRAVTG